MKITKAHKIRLNPTEEQEQYFWKSAGVAKYAFNWALDRWNFYNDYNRKLSKVSKGDKIRISGISLKKEFNKIKPEFVSEVTTWAHQGAFMDIQVSMSNYWRKYKKGELKSPSDYKPRKDKRPFGWPRFKNRNTTPSFYLANISLHFDDFNFWFDKKRVGWINMTEQLRFNGKIQGARISYKQGHWWLSVYVEMEHEIPQHNNDAIGIDFGIKYLAVTSDGEIFDNPKILIQEQKKLRKLQRKLDRQQRANNPDNYKEDGTVKRNCTWVKSNKMIETERQITKLHARIANIRQDISHKMTTSLINDYGIVCIEDLNVSGMLKNHKLAKHISDAGFYEKRRQLEYKAKEKGSVVSVVNRWFPSSKLCSDPECDYKNLNLKLSDRIWTCPECGQKNERDLNAAINIKDEGLRLLDSRCTTQAET